MYSLCHYHNMHFIVKQMGKMAVSQPSLAYIASKFLCISKLQFVLTRYSGLIMSQLVYSHKYAHAGIWEHVLQTSAYKAVYCKHKYA